ncbi:MAG: hypothetical protein QF440_03605 [Candidatus Thalassarchaeaceae archaeon]|jgi:hypothetical protein|nr:hypothetical protein [Candidatus Thalassarchaeaceae archaeon]
MRKRRDESAQVHVIEMITLFWLFFMTATFILQLKVPDPTSPASDGTLDLAAEDAYDSLAGEIAIDPANHTSRLGEMLTSGDLNDACNIMLETLPSSIRGNCWVAVDAGSKSMQGEQSQTDGTTLSTYHLLHDRGRVWTVGIQVWYVGGSS